MPAPRHPSRRAAALPSLQAGVEALRTNPLRTALSTLGVVVGVAALVAVLALGDGMEAYARREMARATDVQNVFVTAHREDLVDGIPVPRDHVVLFTSEDAASAARVPGVSGVSLTASGTTLAVGPAGGEPRAARVTGATAGTAAFYGVEVGAGRFFSAAEEAAAARVAVLSAPLAAALAPAGDTAAVVGATVRLRGTPFRVVGVLAPRGERDGPAAYVPLPAVEAVVAPVEAARPRTLVLRSATVETVPAVKEATEAWLAARRGPGWADDFTVAMDRDRSAELSRAFLLFKLFMGAIVGISLVVGGIGIMNVLLASVTERTREIGIRKAVGARRGDVLLQFLGESVAITGAGSLLGLLAGLGGAFGLAAGMRAWTRAELFAAASLSTLLVSAGAAVVIGLAFGIYPALRAARLSPIEAIRHE